jgi:hypothetical protein
MPGEAGRKPLWTRNFILICIAVLIAARDAPA